MADYAYSPVALNKRTDQIFKDVVYGRTSREIAAQALRVVADNLSQQVEDIQQLTLESISDIRD